MFASITAVFTAIKNYKSGLIAIAIGLLFVVLCIQQGRICYYRNQVIKLKAEINTANVAQCNEIVCQLKEHIVRVGEIAKNTDKITGNISKLKKGKIHEKNYYDVAGRIAERFNNGLR